MTASDPPAAVHLQDGGEVVRAAAQIISVFDGRPDLFLAACANPVRAMLDAGVELSPSAQRYVALRCRFDPAEAERLERLAQQIDEHLGASGDLDPDDDEAISAALRKVGVDIDVSERPAPNKPSHPSEPAASQQPAPQKGQRTQRTPRDVHPTRRSVLAAAETLGQVQRWREVKRAGPDPFEAYAGRHPAIGPLLEYRKKSATQPRFATDEVYERLARTKNGQLSEGVNITLRVRLNGPNGRDDG